MPNRAAALFERARTLGDKPALIFEGQTITFAELAGQVRRLAGGLSALGIAAGSHVGLLLPSGPDFIVAQQALFALGAAVTPLNIAYRAGEIAHAMACCDLAAILTDSLHAGACHAAPGRVIILDESAVRAQIAAAAPLAGPVPRQGSDPAMVLLTSATTGKAKGVVLTHANLAANYDRTPGWLGLDSSSVLLCALPLYNTFGLNQGINAMLATGATMVVLPRFDAAACIEAIARHGCTFLPAVPTMLRKIIDHPLASGDALRPLRRIMTGGAPVPAALLERLLQLAPDAVMLTGYGLTEATALVTLTRVRLDAEGQILHGNSIGQALDGITLAIMDEAGQRLPPHRHGEIVLRGPNVMAGYYRAPEHDALALRHGWLHTGDIGYLDEDGFAYIVDRKKDVIIRGGQNIYPADIEEALYAAPGIAEAAVVGARHAVLGEVPVAYVAASPGHAPDMAALHDHCRNLLASYKLPVAIHLLPELPKGPTGKILRRALRDREMGSEEAGSEETGSEASGMEHSQ